MTVDLLAETVDLLAETVDLLAVTVGDVLCIKISRSSSTLHPPSSCVIKQGVLLVVFHGWLVEDQRPESSCILERL